MIAGNVIEQKDKEQDVANSQFILGTICSIVIFGFIAFDIKAYLNLIGVTDSKYYQFGIYQVLLLGLIHEIIIVTSGSKGSYPCLERRRKGLIQQWKKASFQKIYGL